MPYKSVSELPKGVKALPARAQVIWMKTFNSALRSVKTEQTAFKIAWAAVKKLYKKQGNKWIKK